MSRPISCAVACPVCGTWQPAGPRCTWCTVNMQTGSWVGSDPVWARRALCRLPRSLHEFGPTPFDMLLPGDDGCGTPAGYRRHRLHGETACDDCKFAHAVRKREHRAAAIERRQERAA